VERVGSEDLRKQAYELGLRDAQSRAEWQHGLEQHLWGTVLPDFSLEQKAVLLTEYERGWSAGQP
jgi:hypothetical protein